MIEVTGLSRSYADGDRGTVSVLQDVSLRITKGEWVALVGRSGSGKSTLLHILGGLDAAFSGRVSVAGVDLKSLDAKRLAQFRNTQVGFVFQSFHLIDGLSVFENAALPLAFSEHRQIENETTKIEQALARVGLGDKGHRKPSQLSGGERQRVAIARALVLDASLLLCDEPTGNLDVETAAGIIDLFVELNRQGLTIVTVTHEEKLQSHAHRVVRLAQGKIN
jgi:putative ABC transport system ATP-binding protein